jgi:hypothetical protein
VEGEEVVVFSLLEDWGSGLCLAEPASVDMTGDEPTLVVLPTDMGGLL